MTETDVANKALTGHLGIPPIDDIDSVTDNVAVTLKFHIDSCRKQVLREIQPGFARKELDLAIVANETSNLYDYVYGYPSDCIQIRQIWNGTTNDDPRIVFETSAHSSGTSEVILTDREDAILIYTQDVTNYDLFDDDTIEVLALLLAWKSVMPLKRDKDLRARLERELAISLGRASKNNKVEQHVEQPKHTRYIDSRT